MKKFFRGLLGLCSMEELQEVKNSVVRLREDLDKQDKELKRHEELWYDHNRRFCLKEP